MQDNAPLIGVTLAPASELGFPAAADVTSLQSVAHLFGATKRRCGIYFLAFQGGLFYVGQAVDVVRRFSQHRKNHDDIIGFSFIAVPKPELDVTERALIFKAESLGLKLTNAVHVTRIVGDTDLDLVVPMTDQNHWLAATDRVALTIDSGPKIVLPESQQVRYAKQFSKFGRQPLSARSLALLKQYLQTCVPAPRLTEYSFWAVSCMPTTGTEWKRLLCVNAAFMELFVVGHAQRDPTALWSFVNVAEDVLLEHWKSISRLEKKYPSLRVERCDYRDAGQHQARLFCQGDAAFMEVLLHDPGVSKAAAALVLRVMRKRATIFGKYHCPQLADLALTA